MNNKQIGEKGESLAINWLRRNGYKIMARNWRSGRYEIDIIACKAATLHCIEVKTRRTDTYGFPEESISPRKLRHLIAAAERLSELLEESTLLQIDIIAVDIKDHCIEIFLLENAGMGMQR